MAPLIILLLILVISRFYWQVDIHDYLFQYWVAGVIQSHFSVLLHLPLLADGGFPWWADVSRDLQALPDVIQDRAVLLGSFHTRPSHWLPGSLWTNPLFSHRWPGQPMTEDPLRLWAGRLLAVLIQCDTLGTPISIVIPGRIVWGHLYPANKGPSFISHQKHPSLPLLASILTFPLTCSQLKTKIKYLCWKLEMLGLKTNSSENFPLEQCP